MSREYRKRKRAESEAETRERITEATMHLHEAVGPAKTTVSAIAEEAGVQRATVYRHFPEEADLINACGAHWSSLNPPPDPSAWVTIEDPDARLRTALAEIYDWFDRTETMMVRILRDRDLVPALDRSMSPMDAYFEATANVLVRGRPRRKRVRAAIGHALEFETWRSLVRHQGLRRDDAIELVTRLVG